MRISNEDPAVATWALASLQNAKVDAKIERYPYPPEYFGPKEGADVVGEIRGREKPDEWVVLAASDDAYNAASLIEAARAIQLTGIRPRRSIRFVIFVEGEGASFHYVQTHHSELDHISAVIILNAAANPLDGFILEGRNDIESGVREAVQPISSVMGLTHYTFDAPFESYGLGFLLEGIPTLLTPLPESAGTSSTSDLAPVNSPDETKVPQLKRNIAIAAVAAFGIAERAEPIGPRQPHAEIESLLKKTGLEQQMKDHRLWSLWESGELGTAFRQAGHSRQEAK